MNIVAVATDMVHEDTDLIKSMLVKFLPVQPENISVIDCRSYRPKIKDKTKCLITYGKHAATITKANNYDLSIPHLTLPDIQELRRKPENKGNILSVVKKLEKFELDDPTEEIVSITLRYQDGDVVIKEGEDIVPDEMKQLVALLGKLKAEEVEIVFRQRANNGGD
jgi:hypothetical protein